MRLLSLVVAAVLLCAAPAIHALPPPLRIRATAVADSRIMYAYFKDGANALKVANCLPSKTALVSSCTDLKTSDISGASRAYDVGTMSDGFGFVVEGRNLRVCSDASCNNVHLSTLYGTSLPGAADIVQVAAAWGTSGPVIAYLRQVAQDELELFVGQCTMTQDSSTGARTCVGYSEQSVFDELLPDAGAEIAITLLPDGYPVVAITKMGDDEGAETILCLDIWCRSTQHRIHSTSPSKNPELVMTDVGTPFLKYQTYFTDTSGFKPVSTNFMHCIDPGCTEPADTLELLNYQEATILFHKDTRRVHHVGLFKPDSSAPVGKAGSCVERFCTELTAPETTVSDIGSPSGVDFPEPFFNLLRLTNNDTVLVYSKADGAASVIDFVVYKDQCILNLCPAAATCQTEPFVGDVCVCPRGMDLDGFKCVAFQECQRGYDDLCYWEGSSCVEPKPDLSDPFQCKCENGYRVAVVGGNLKECRFINVCDQDDSLCGDHGTCEPDEEADAFYVCECDFGFTGDDCDEVITCPTSYLGLTANTNCDFKHGSQCRFGCPSGFQPQYFDVLCNNSHWQGDFGACYGLPNDNHLLATANSLYQRSPVQLLDHLTNPTFSLLSGPAWATVHYTGVVSGVPPSPGSFEIKLKVLSPDLPGPFELAPFKIEVAQPMLILGQEVVLTRGTLYTRTSAKGPNRNFKGGNAPFEFRFKAGVAPPDGIQLEENDGTLVGRPISVEQVAGLVVEVVDAAGAVLSFDAFDVVVVEPLQVNWKRTASPPTPVEGEVFSLPPPPGVNKTGGKGEMIFGLEGNPWSGLSINSDNGALSGVPIKSDEPYQFAIVVRDLSGVVSLETFSGTTKKKPDCDVAANGPNGKPCSNGLCVDGVPGDSKFTCDCSGTNFTGANCDTTGGVNNPPDPNNNPSPSAASQSNSTALIGGVAGGIVLLILAALFIMRRKSAATPFDFDAELERMREEGLLREESDKKVPREIKRSQIKMLDKLGAGAFGDVFKGTVDEQATTGVPEYIAAIKTLKDDPSGQEKLELMREAALMAQFNHPNVVGLIGVCTRGMPMLLIVQFCEHGALVSFLKKHDNLSVEALLKIAWDCAKGMEYLSGMGLVHRDLAARNVLIDSSQVCKIADFGLSRDLDTDEYYRAGSKGLVPVRWTALEALEEQKYSSKSDVWSYGILLHEVFTYGKTPYEGMTNHKVWLEVKAGYRLPRAETCPPKVYNEVLLKCWDVSPEARPSFADVCTFLDTEFDFTSSERKQSSSSLVSEGTGRRLSDVNTSLRQDYRNGTSGGNSTSAGCTLNSISEDAELFPEDVQGYVDFAAMPAEPSVASPSRSALSESGYLVVSQDTEEDGPVAAEDAYSEPPSESDVPGNANPYIGLEAMPRNMSNAPKFHPTAFPEENFGFTKSADEED